MVRALQLFLALAQFGLAVWGFAVIYRAYGRAVEADPRTIRIFACGVLGLASAQAMLTALAR